MIEVICQHSGLKFQAENRRKKIHPDIYWWIHEFAKRDYWQKNQVRDTIATGKMEGWDTLEKFESEIRKSLEPPEYDFCGESGSYVARLWCKGSESIIHEFVEPVWVYDDDKYFMIENLPDGIYEACQKVHKYNKGTEIRRYYYFVSKGQKTEISQEYARSIVPNCPNQESIHAMQETLGTDYLEAIKAILSDLPNYGIAQVNTLSVG